MAYNVPKIPNLIDVARIRMGHMRLDIRIILSTVRKHTGIPPKALRRANENSEEIVEVKKVSIYLAHVYGKLSYRELTEYFSMSKRAIKILIYHPLTELNLPLLEALQNKLESRLTDSVPVDLTTNRLLTEEKLELYKEKNKFSYLKSLSSPDYECFSADVIGMEDKDGFLSSLL